MTIVRAFPRLHFGLADLGRVTPRAYGGAGVLLEGPWVDIEAVVAPTRALVGFDRLDERGQRDVAAALQRLEAWLPEEVSFQVSLLTEVHEHVGLGSKTSLVLGALQAASRAGGYEIEPQRLQLLSGRGGASGVGVHAFFMGGFVMDGGHPQSAVPTLLPSAAREPIEVPPLLTHLEVPMNWRFRLALALGERPSGDAEAEFFEAATPVPEDEVLRTIALLHHGVAPAIATENMKEFAAALAGIQKLGFKARELAAQPRRVRSLVDSCSKVGPAGLSSMGPLVFVATSSDAQEERLDAMLAATDVLDLGTWPARSRGFELLS